MSYTIPFRRVVGVTSSIPRRAFNSQSRLGISANLDSDTISKITQKEREITGSDGPVKGGPTAEAQKHAGQPINSQSLRDIAKGEKKITGEDGPVRGGPTSVAQSHVGKADQGVNKAANRQEGHLDSHTISEITQAERDITGSVEPVRGGPTAQAQSHFHEPINSDNLHDITEGGKKVTGGDRVQGGPTATAQSELSKSRS